MIIYSSVALLEKDLFCLTFLELSQEASLCNSPNGGLPSPFVLPSYAL